MMSWSDRGLVGTIGQPAESPAAMPAHRFRRMATVRKMIVALALALMKNDDCDGDGDDDEKEQVEDKEEEEGYRMWCVNQ